MESPNLSRCRRCGSPNVALQVKGHPKPECFFVECRCGCGGPFVWLEKFKVSAEEAETLAVAGWNGSPEFDRRVSLVEADELDTKAKTLSERATRIRAAVAAEAALVNA